ncbi:TonB-dependent receptor [Paraglaciecola sp.]|uniref:TonB-dependent receptor n=1 Tax=Paraglaciecola sp. TaxID=1920173 RepID=UPI003EF6EC85
MKKYTLSLLLLLLSNKLLAHGLSLENITIKGRHINLVGDAVSASEGIVGQDEINTRPMLRVGEVLELVPGMVVTQHSGSGKANQYFLRGFNLDHGTDFSTFVDGMPINMPSHGHGQGYIDLNFIIPETIKTMSYSKGAYYADIGDFSGAGGVKINSATHIDDNLISATIGQNGYKRALVMSDFEMAGGNSLIAVEGQTYDGPWSDINEDIGKTNVMFKHTQSLKDGHISLAFMAYDNNWNSADQIPTRAVQQGLINELGSLDTSVGGDSNRYSLNMNWQSGAWTGAAYVIDYGLQLWSNFTYFLDDAINGDQFEQVDNRQIFGGQLEYETHSRLGEQYMTNRFGGAVRYDNIREVGLYHTKERQRLGVTRNDKIQQQSSSLFWENTLTLTDNLRSVIGVRYDNLQFDVEDQVGINRFGIDLSSNSGQADDDILSFKGSLVYTISHAWEAYVSAGQGFHSNDARGTTIVIDPTTGDKADQVDPLVDSFGYEAGMRGFIDNDVNLSFALWSLDLDSELLFVGDAGNTEASRPSRRKGLEFVAYYYLAEGLSTDFEYAYTESEFTDQSTDGRKIPGALNHVLQAGVNFDLNDAWQASVRFRYFGKRPLIEDASQQSDPTDTWNLKLAYEQPRWRAALDILNLTNSKAHDIDYFYSSRLANEPIGSATNDIHYHPIEPRTIRLTLSYQY